ncbi:MAG: outer membrane lipoprotein-sorting protein, partial [Thiovulaceae bacterium]|nr:outer membrane lipoprotein-sorting protein [Sulfurimonadaceae bacterium]
MKSIALLLLIAMGSLMANEADDIIKKVEENARGKDVYMKMRMEIASKRYERSITMESWAEGKKKSFTKILEPARERGITFLNLDNQMWQYVPKIERVIKIPPSMMLQSWMGSDFTNDDLVKQSSIVDDYTPTVLDREGDIVTLQLTPREDAAVVWGKIVSKIDTRSYTQVEEIFYDDMDEKVRIMRYSKTEKFGSHYLPTVMEVIPLDP